MDASPKSKRRRFQFSMRTLIAVTLLSCVALGGWLQFMRNRAAENRERVAAVAKKLGEDVEVDFEYEELRPATWLEKMFDDPGGPDDPIGVLNISAVDFAYARISDAGLEHLKGLTNLEALDLEGTNITDAGLEHLKGLTKLEDLELRNTNVTDAGLEHLKGLTDLEWLGLYRTNVTAEGVKKLQQALPNCMIDH